VKLLTIILFGGLRYAPLLTQVGVVFVLGAIAYGAIGAFIYANAGGEMSRGRFLAVYGSALIAGIAATLGILALR
jgi:hypothetical protein